MAKITITLTSYNMGDVTEAEYDSYVVWTTERIERDYPLAEVDVDALPFGAAGDTRVYVSGRVDAEGHDEADVEHAIREAISYNWWEEWCASQPVAAD